MDLLQELESDRLTPSRLWAGLDLATRELAARALYGHPSGERSARKQANQAVAVALRFREVAVQKLAVERRADHLARSVRPDDTLASSLLISLHLAERPDLLGTFLDALEIPHDAGAIDAEYESDSFDPKSLEQAVSALDAEFSREHVDLYLFCLVAMDPDVWGGLTEILQRRHDG